MTLLLANLLLATYMTGVIWFVQVAHYPLLARVPAAVFPEYERANTRRTGWIVAPPMVAELGAAIGLAAAPPSESSAPAAWVLLVLLAAIWTSTAFVQVPCHRRLEAGFDARTHRRLVRSNTLRTAAWTARTAVLTALVFHATVA